MPDKKPNKQPPKPSEDFIDAIVYGGSSVIDCQFCNRTHFVSDEREFDWEDGEYERLLKNQEENPDKYIIHQESSVSWGHLDGKQFVADCPCNSASKYEQLFLNSRYIIQKYFENKAKTMEREAAEMSELSDRVTEDVPKLAG